MRVLSVRARFGSVSQCPNGCFHISLPNLSFRMTESEYRLLLEMLADSAEAACAENGPFEPPLRPGTVDSRDQNPAVRCLSV